MFGWIVRIAIYTSMRKSEILTLRVEQIDLTRHVVRLNKTKNGTARTVPLSRRAVRVFRHALANEFRPTDTDLLFPGNKGVMTSTTHMLLTGFGGACFRTLELKIYTSMTFGTRQFRVSSNADSQIRK